MKPSDLLSFSCLGRLIPLAALALAGCVNPATGWLRSKTTDAARDADYAECKSVMRSLSGNKLAIDQDIESARGSDWRQSGTYDMNVASTSGGDREYANHVLYSCMVDKGYHPRS
jgi:hypothetical protein